MPTSISLTTWLAAARLRTLPLALSSILLGSLLALHHKKFSVTVLLLSMLTATIYQVLSNFANDLGDGLKGTDANRVGEKRAVASGSINIAQMKTAVGLFTILSLLSGTVLSIVATRNLPLRSTLFFVTLGALATLAARSYTMGKRAYGYAGLGDVFVVLFFGWVGVVGAYFLHTGSFEATIFLPATAVGFLATGVLNLNNLRDAETDLAAGKRTLVVRLGRPKAKVYQFILLGGALLLQIGYVIINQGGWAAYLFLLTSPLLAFNLLKMLRATAAAAFDPLLKPLAITTLLFCLLAGIGLNF